MRALLLVWSHATSELRVQMEIGAGLIIVLFASFASLKLGLLVLSLHLRPEDHVNTGYLFVPSIQIKSKEGNKDQRTGTTVAKGSGTGAARIEAHFNDNPGFHGALVIVDGLAAAPPISSSWLNLSEEST